MRKENAISDPCRYSWRVSDIFVVLFLYAILLFLFITAVEFFLGGSDTPPLDKANSAQTLFEDSVDALIMTALVFATIKRHGATWSSIGVSSSNAARNICIGLGVGSLLWVLASVVDLGIKWLLGESLPHPYLEMLSASNNPFDYVAIITSTVVLAPISEEILYRGLIFTVLKVKFGTPVGVISSSLIFSAMHFIPSAILQTFLAGIGLGLLAAKTRSLVSSIVAHMTINLLTLVASGL